MKNDIAIFTPMANEEKNAKKIILELLSYKKFFRKFKYFIIIDKISTDNTYKIVKQIEKKNKSLKVIWAPNNKSIVDAYMQGYKNCLKTNYNWILEIDAGGSHQPKDLLVFLKFMNNKYDCIFGSRFCSGGKMINSNQVNSFRALAQITRSVPAKVKFSKMIFNGSNEFKVEGSAFSDQGIYNFIANLNSKPLIKKASLISMNVATSDQNQAKAYKKGFIILCKLKGI